MQNDEQQCREMFRHCQVKLLLASLLAFQAAVFVVVTVISQEWYSAHLSRTSEDDDSRNETLTLNTFLVEYEKYCSSQLIPKASNIATGNKSFSNLCECVPNTLGRYCTGLGNSNELFVH